VSQDGFGTRTLDIDQESGDPVEVLTFAPILAREPEFAAAVGERVARVARVRHAMYARVRTLDQSSPDALRLCSDHVAGWRLDHVLAIVERERLTLDIGAIITLLRQLIPAVALFSRHQRDATIGTIGPERLILTAQGRLVLAEYVLGPGLETLQFPRERLWREFRVALPHEASTTRIPPSADVVGIGVVALSLLLGRRLKDDEYLVSLGDLFETLSETSAGTTKKLSDPFCTWVARALQFDVETAFQSTQEAQVAFEEMLARERSYVTPPAHLDRFITTFEQIAGAPRKPSRPADDELVAAVAAALPPAPTVMPAKAAAVAPPEPAVTPTESPVVTEESSPVAAAFGRQESRPPVSAPSASSAPGAPGASGVPAVPEAPVAPRAADVPVAPIAFGTAAPSAVPAWRRFALPALAALVLVEAGVIAWLASSTGSGLSGGELVIQSRPVAARVTIDGEERGVTPFEAEMSPGSHVVEVRVGRSEPRVIPVVIHEGVQSALYVELQSVATVGGLEVRSEPARARVTVGGQYRGDTPLVLKDLPPGEVEVVVQSSTRQVKQNVRIEPGITSQLVVPLGR
jgi:hypothetical protein